MASNQSEHQTDYVAQVAQLHQSLRAVVNAAYELSVMLSHAHAGMQIVESASQQFADQVTHVVEKAAVNQSKNRRRHQRCGAPGNGESDNNGGHD